MGEYTRFRMRRMGMRHLFGVLALALAVVAAAPAPQAAQADKMKTMNATGTVSAVTPASLTVKGKNATDQWTFTIDKDTTVTARGATHKSLALQAESKASVLTEFVKVGDSVTVSYHDMGSTKHAATINVTTQVPK
jgi:hypothetical protein